jgi:hypothetical protein
MRIKPLCLLALVHTEARGNKGNKCFNDLTLGSYCEQSDACRTPLGRTICPSSCNTCPAQGSEVTHGKYEEGRYVSASNQCNYRDIIKLGCMHGCRINEQSGKGECYCMDGYIMLDDKATCVDVNECYNDPCNKGTHKCVNLDGHYKCIKIKKTNTASSAENYYMTDEPCKHVSNPTCGTANRMQRIVGGRNTSTQRWPWIAYLTIFSTTGTGQCAGSFISDNWILTANHCILNARYIMATAGATFTQGRVNDNIPAVSHYKIIEKIPFNGTVGYENFHEDDIALLKVEYVRGNFKPFPICLPSGEKTEEATVCYAIGWGLKKAGGYPADVLQEVELPIGNMNLCQKRYQELTDREVFKDRNLCAGSYSGGKDACTGDSGGPLMCQRSSSCSWYASSVVVACINPSF